MLLVLIFLGFGLGEFLLAALLLFELQLALLHPLVYLSSLLLFEFIELPHCLFLVRLLLFVVEEARSTGTYPLFFDFCSSWPLLNVSSGFFRLWTPDSEFNVICRRIKDLLC